jgi:hypothetical protein
LKRIVRARKKRTCPPQQQIELNGIAAHFQTQCQPCLPNEAGCLRQIELGEEYLEIEQDPSEAELTTDMRELATIDNVLKLVKDSSY